MAKQIELGVRLTADGKGFVGAVKVSGDALDRFAGRAQRVDSATRRMARTTGLAETSVRRTGQAFLAAHGAMAKYLTGAGSPAHAGIDPGPSSGWVCLHSLIAFLLCYDAWRTGREARQLGSGPA